MTIVTHVYGMWSEGHGEHFVAHRWNLFLSWFYGKRVRLRCRRRQRTFYEVHVHVAGHYVTIVQSEASHVSGHHVDVSKVQAFFLPPKHSVRPDL